MEDKNPKIKISKTTVDNLPMMVEGQAIYWDATLPGFGIRVGQKSKAYIIQKKINGKAIRYTLGLWGQITPDQARRLAMEKLAEMTKGLNPAEVKREAKIKSVTLQEVFEDYKEARKDLKPKTLYDYKNCFNACFEDWKNKPITEITKDMIERQHKSLGEERGKVYANFSMRILRLLFNFAIGKYETTKGESLIRDNPVKRLSDTKAWYKVTRRTDYIAPEDFPAFFASLEQLANDTMRDYFLVLLFTGLRREEAAQLRWENINLSSATLTVPDTKNNEPHILPLSNYLLDIFKKRKAEAGGSEWVFSGEKPDQHIVEPRRSLEIIKKESGLEISIHGFRRTFATLAESLDISTYTVKRLLNHKMPGDVTAGYIVKDIGRMREPMQRITDFILAKSGTQAPGKVLQIKNSTGSR